MITGLRVEGQRHTSVRIVQSLDFNSAYLAILIVFTCPPSPRYPVFVLHAVPSLIVSLLGAQFELSTPWGR
jgi:hypothetical protein